MRLLLTGGAGYIATRFLHAILDRPDVEEVISVDLRAPRLAHPRLRGVVRSVTEDLRDLFTEKGRPLDVAMHLAWVLDPLHDAARQRAICIGGTERFLEGCAAGAVRQVFYMSSGTAYGAHPSHATPRVETDALRPEHHFQYSAEKREGEGLCQAYGTAHPDALLQIGRPAVVGGPNVSNYLFRLMEKPVAFRALGYDPALQIVHEDDVAAALVAIVTSRVAGAFNITTDDAVPLSELARLAGATMVALPFPLLYGTAALAWRLHLSAVMEAPPEFVYFTTYPWLMSNRRLHDELGFSFRFGTRDTLKAFLAARPGRG